MTRIVAIDYGTKRVGIAVTDPLRIFATALDTVPAKDIITFLKQYDAKEGIESFVVGMPKTLSNEDSSNAKFVRIFIKELKKTFPDKEIFEIDERFTSSIALDTMIRGGMKKMERRKKENADKISATLLLQDFLERKR